MKRSWSAPCSRLAAWKSPEVRKLAQEHDLETSGKKDSTGICFIGERRFKDFLKQYIPAQPGKIETTDGEVIGEHHGLMYHTIGQRQGLGIGGLKSASELPWYVVEKDLTRNVLVVGQGNDNPLLFSGSLASEDIFWINDEPPVSGTRLKAKVRYRQPGSGLPDPPAGQRQLVVNIR